MVKKDKIDKRDFIYNSISEIQDKVDLRQYAELNNQYSTSACVACATCSCIELFQYKNSGVKVDYSRLFLYYWLREPYNEFRNKDQGSYLRDGFKVCNRKGIPEEQYWPFNIRKVNIEPNRQTPQRALENRVITYKRIVSLYGVLSALSEGYPVIFSLGLTDKFPSTKKDEYLGSTNGDKILSSHAMNIVGYDGKCLIVENSWGTDFGDQGYFWLPYEVFIKDFIDSWCCTEFRTGLDPDSDTYSPSKWTIIWDKIQVFFNNLWYKITK